MFELSMDGKIATIRIMRGERRNAVTICGWSELDALVRRIPTSNAGILVIKSADPHDFCAGSDLSELRELASDTLMRRRFRGAMESAFKQIRGLGIPTICVIHGGCYGTGVSLAAACDLRVAHPEASFAITSARFGISYPQSDLARLVDLIGPGQAAHLVYTSEAISGQRAYDIGLVEAIDSTPDTGAEFIQAVAANASNSLASLKAVLLGRRTAQELFDSSFDSAEFAGSMRAFADRKVEQP